MVDELESLKETYNAISALFPDNAPHKNPVTGVSLLDDVRDAIARTPLCCIFCSFQGTLTELKQHSAGCQEHPAVKAMAKQGKI